MTRNRCAALLALCALTAGGCASETEPPGPGAPTRSAAAAPAGTTAPAGARPDTLRGEVLVEGRREPVTMRLYRPAAGFPIGFSTYLPEGIAADAVSAGEGDAVRFVASSGGTREERAAVILFVHPEGHTAADARAMADAVVPAGQTSVDEARRYAWSTYERRFRGPDDLVGHAAIGEHAGRHFSLTVQYPAEWGGGFAPRAALILEEWRWDDGRRLQERPAGATR